MRCSAPARGISRNSGAILLNTLCQCPLPDFFRDDDISWADYKSDSSQTLRSKKIWYYVVLEDGTLLNAELIKQGYARVIAPSPFHYYEEFKSYEREAKAAGLASGVGSDTF